MENEKTKFQKLRKKTSFLLNDSDTKQGRYIVLFLLFINLFACFHYVVGTYYEEQTVPFWFELTAFIIVILFLGEYILRIWSTEHRFKYIFSVYGIIDLLSIMPAIFLPGFTFLRSFKVLRILRFMRLVNPKVFIFKKLNPYQLQVCRTFLTVLTILFIASGFIFYAEQNCGSGAEQVIHTFADSFTFCVTTLSTVGYGKMYPATPLGNFFTVLMIICGVLFVPWHIGKLLRLIIKSEIGKVMKKCGQCGTSEHCSDAEFCRICGSKL
ncbi:MAG: ion transporter [Victivallales bacterium]|nr:ion transporter [Victivallales bacterium]